MKNTAALEPNATASTPATVESDPTASTPTQPSTRSGRKVHLPTSVWRSDPRQKLARPVWKTDLLEAARLALPVEHETLNLGFGPHFGSHCDVPEYVGVWGSSKDQP
ncbi:hypothetical protein TNCV_2449541 [Trichonephila clavipes]|uniref:Uncharacterized protein n=1 Tax=Trichonephila clavipes TaxID=2585209 RepID=A0A8X6V1Y0_TRICX|nr:hypothetical protein TNCV_2449541 [Trichonephila clavipes]